MDSCPLSLPGPADGVRGTLRAPVSILVDSAHSTYPAFQASLQTWRSFNYRFMSIIIIGQSLINGGNAPFYNFSEFESLLLIHLLGLGIITSVKVLRRSLSVTAFSVALPMSDYLPLCGHRGSSWASQRLLRSQNSLSTLCRHYYYYYYYYYY